MLDLHGIIVVLLGRRVVAHEGQEREHQPAEEVEEDLGGAFVSDGTVEPFADAVVEVDVGEVLDEGRSSVADHRGEEDEEGQALEGVAPVLVVLLLGVPG